MLGSTAGRGETRGARAGRLELLPSCMYDQVLAKRAPPAGQAASLAARAASVVARVLVASSLLMIATAVGDEPQGGSSWFL